MSKKEKCLLVRQAAKLATLGVTVERERGRLKILVERGIPYTAPEMLAALERFEKVNKEWKQLESEHLTLKSKYEDTTRLK